MLQWVWVHQLDTLTMLPSSSSWKFLIITNPNTMSWNCLSLSQISSINIHHSHPTDLFSSKFFLSITQHQPALLVEGTSVRTLATISLSTFKSIIRLLCYKWQYQNTFENITCYTDITAVRGIRATSDLFLHILSNLIYLLASYIIFMSYMMRTENFTLFCTYAMLIKKAFILVKNLEVTQYNYITTPKYLTEW